MLSQREWWRLLGRCFCDHVQYSILTCPCCRVGQEEQLERMPWSQPTRVRVNHPTRTQPKDRPVSHHLDA